MTYQIPQGDADFLTRLFGPQIPWAALPVYGPSVKRVDFKPGDETQAVEVLIQTARYEDISLIAGWSVHKQDRICSITLHHQRP